MNQNTQNTDRSVRSFAVQHYDKLIYILLIILFTMVGFTVGVAQSNRVAIQKLDASNPVQASEAMRSISYELFSIMDNQYIKQIKPEDWRNFIYNSVQGMVSRLSQPPYNDPFSNFFDPRDYKNLMDDTQGEYAGIGVSISSNYEYQVPQIVEVFNNAPAKKAGLVDGDLIIWVWSKELEKIAKENNQVDEPESMSVSSFGILSTPNTPDPKTLSENDKNKYPGIKSTYGKPLDVATSWIKGSPGTKVHVWVMRAGFEEPKLFIIDRAKVEVESVLQPKLLPNNIGYIKVTGFNEDTDQQFKDAMATIRQKNGKGIILDLRNNSGGIMQMALLMLSSFIEEGKLLDVVYRDGKKVSTWQIRNRRLTESNAKGGSPRVDFQLDNPVFRGPVIVLVNSMSASSSEIVAGGLKDTKRALLMGEKTFGKAAVQQVYTLTQGIKENEKSKEPLDPEKLGLVMTIAHYRTPGGYDLHTKGIQPDIKFGIDEIINHDPKVKELDKKIEATKKQILKLQNEMVTYIRTHDTTLDAAQSEMIKLLKKSNQPKK